MVASCVLIKLTLGIDDWKTIDCNPFRTEYLYRLFELFFGRGEYIRPTTLTEKTTSIIYTLVDRFPYLKSLGIDTTDYEVVVS